MKIDELLITLEEQRNKLSSHLGLDPFSGFNYFTNDTDLWHRPFFITARGIKNFLYHDPKYKQIGFRLYRDMIEVASGLEYNNLHFIATISPFEATHTKRRQEDTYKWREVGDSL